MDALRLYSGFAVSYLFSRCQKLYLPIFSDIQIRLPALGNHSNNDNCSSNIYIRHPWLPEIQKPETLAYYIYIDSTPPLHAANTFSVNVSNLVCNGRFPSWTNPPARKIHRAITRASGAPRPLLWRTDILPYTA
ncbi:hypothetical protein M413DRAFT_388049 [Hebeloma cylindrosporum]|uniref:Uncharacterized protein n=1 Tax=Hebeloma cylindrosporum TaxID=76867 RepID=A0A0C2YRU6_HEBCY|nr:hypothetical protein M413DRAFT_388049 [Hebeloma cylindrosporum h7]